VRTNWQTDQPETFSRFVLNNGVVAFPSYAAEMNGSRIPPGPLSRRTALRITNMLTHGEGSFNIHVVLEEPMV